MSFKKKSTYIRQECEYQSPDGEVYEIAFIKHGERNYVQWIVVPIITQPQSNESSETQAAPESDIGLIRSNPVIIDGEMLEGMYDLYRKMMHPAAQTTQNHQKKTGLRRPNITDHTNTNEAPYQSFDASSLVQEDVEKTPEEWSLENASAGWKKDAVSRKNIARPYFTPKASAGNNFGRVGASDVI